MDDIMSSTVYQLGATERATPTAFLDQQRTPLSWGRMLSLSMAFVPDRCFPSLEEAWAFILNQYADRTSERLWYETESQLLMPHEVPRYIFRGECGEFETTKAAIHRPETYMLKNGTRLSDLDLRALQLLIPDLAARFTESSDYDLDGHQAIGLLQHYGLPTWMIDFTGNLTCAFAFAAAGTSKVGRVAVVPSRALSANGSLVDLSEHNWAERAQRQAAFGVITTEDLGDLKSEAARSQLNVSWYEFPVSDSERAYLRRKHEELVNLSDDPSAGFLRFHITEYVEARGKFSADLTDWLIEGIPIVPRCYLVKAIEREEAIVNYRAANALPAFDEKTEAEYSRRYWSSAYHERSGDRLKDWDGHRRVGSIVCDPRTYHYHPNL